MTLRLPLFFAVAFVAKAGPAQLLSEAQSISSYDGMLVESVFSADLDNDGDIDVLRAAGSSIQWFENLGDENFTSYQFINEFDGTCLHAADYDSDGDIDVISGGDFGVVLNLNYDSGSFDPWNFIGSLGDGNYPTAVHSADIDGDGHMDVLATFYDGQIAWIRNDGENWFDPIQVLPGSANHPEDITAADLDEDGDLDVLTAIAGDSEIIWHENLGGNQFGSPQIITTQADDPRSVCSEDLDGDGDMDVLSASFNDDKVAWYQNLGGGLFGGQQIISNQVVGAIDMETADLDIDGDMDILIAALYDETIIWFENLGGGNFGSQQIIDNIGLAIDVHVSDLDGDADLDVLAVSFIPGNITWYENLSLQGCTDSGACNYDPDAVADNGSCCYTNCGCTDPLANNYSVTATCENGTCQYGNEETMWYLDADGDGYSADSQTAFSSPGSGWSTSIPVGSGDCNDGNNLINPAVSEVCDNNIDDNCNGDTDEGCCLLTASAVATNVTCVGGSNGAVNLSITNATLPVIFAWNNGAITEDINNLSSGTYTVTVTDILGCTANAQANVGNNGGTAPGNITAMSGPNGVCANQNNVLFSVSPIPGATSYQWTLPLGVTGSSSTNEILLNFASNYFTSTICVRAVNECGQGPLFCKTVSKFTTLPSLPSSIIGQNTQVCGGLSLTYSVNPVANATSYLWTLPANCSIVSGANTNSITIAFASNFTGGTLLVRSVNCNGMSGNKSLVLVGLPAVPGAISGPANNVCQGSTHTFSIAAVNGATGYVWTAPSGAIINSGQGLTSISVTFPANFYSGQITVRSESSCGLSSPRAKNVTKIPIISSGITGPKYDLCGGGSFSYSIPAVTDAVSYNWSVPASCVITTNNGNSIVLSVPSNFVSGQLCVTATNSCGGSISTCRGLYAIPEMPASITGSTSVCPSQANINYSTPQIGTSTYTWTVPSGVSINSGQNTNTVNVNWGSSSGSMQVKANNACGSSANKALAVNIVSCMQQIDDTNFSSLEISKDEELLNIYPNPNNGQFTVVCSKPGLYTLYNELGSLVQTFNVAHETGTEIHVENLSAGLYFMVSNQGPETISERIIVSGN